jgi:hypothetical protein
MTVTVQVSSRLARAIRAGSKQAASVLNCVTARGGKLVPTFEGDAGENLVNFFQVEEIAGSKVEELVYALQHIEGVEAAYVKPAEEPP